MDFLRVHQDLRAKTQERTGDQYPDGEKKADLAQMLAPGPQGEKFLFLVWFRQIVRRK
jgi:hypothetical protein